MSSPDGLHGFAYGEELDGVSGRSLGYRLLAPAAPEPWSAEVEALARSLQATPYPEHWPAAELFCSLLLGNGQRLVAVARYGLTDHTPSRRRGGLELIGVVGRRDLKPATALAIYGWLCRRQHRAETIDLRQLGGRHTFGEVSAAPLPERHDLAAPVLPVRAWQSGTLLFTASSASAPDAALGLLEQTETADWQWLPLCGADFPLETYASRGPLVAWTTQLFDLGIRLGGPAPRVRVSTPRTRWAIAGLTAVLLLLLGANLWALLALYSRLDVPGSAPLPEKPAALSQPSTHPAPTSASHESSDDLALALYRLLRSEGAVELTESEGALIARYRRLAIRDPALRVEDKKGQAALGLVGALAGRSADQVARLINEEFREKGYDRDLVRLISQRVRDRLLAEVGKGAGRE
jgi:hypothetical protein